MNYLSFNYGRKPNYPTDTLRLFIAGQEVGRFKLMKLKHNKAGQADRPTAAFFGSQTTGSGLEL